MGPSKKQYVDTEEWKLILRCQKGERKAFDELFGRYQQRIFNSILHFLGDDAESLDVCQEVFIHVFRSIKGFRGDSSFFTWIYRIVVNLARNRYKQKYRRRKVVAETVETEDGQGPLERAVSHEPSPERVFQNKELNLAIRQELAALHVDQRMPLVLREIEGLAYEEIASILKVNHGTIKSRIARGRMILQEKLQKYL